MTTCLALFLCHIHISAYLTRSALGTTVKLLQGHETVGVGVSFLSFPLDLGNTATIQREQMGISYYKEKSYQFLGQKAQAWHCSFSLRQIKRPRIGSGSARCWLGCVPHSPHRASPYKVVRLNSSSHQHSCPSLFPRSLPWGRDKECPLPSQHPGGR